MIWLFERGDEVVRLETRVDNGTGEFVAVITWSDSPAVTERFVGYEQFHARMLEMEKRLAADNWTQIGPPEIMPQGWRGPS